MKRVVILIVIFVMTTFQACLGKEKAADLYGRLNRLSMARWQWKKVLPTDSQTSRIGVPSQQY